MQDPTTEALALAIEIPTKTIASSTQLIQQLLEVTTLIMLGRKDPERYGARTGGLADMAARATEKVVDAASAAAAGGKGGEKSLKYMKGIAEKRGDTLEMLNACKDMNAILDEEGFVTSCRKYGVDVAVVRGRDSGRPTLLVTSSDKSLALAAFFENIREGVEDFLGEDAADDLIRKAERVAQSASIEQMEVEEKARKGYAELNARLADPDDLEIDRDTFIAENSLPSLELMERRHVTQDGEEYVFDLRQDPAGRTMWCCDTDDGCLLAADPSGAFMAYHNGAPAYGGGDVGLKDDHGRPWMGRTAGWRIPGEEQQVEAGLLSGIGHAVNAYTETRNMSRDEGIDLDEAFGRTVASPKGGELHGDPMSEETRAAAPEQHAKASTTWVDGVPFERDAQKHTGGGTPTDAKKGKPAHETAPARKAMR